jgi:hypothetical protein
MTLTKVAACPGCDRVLTRIEGGRRFECRNSHCPATVWRPEEVIDDV